jgi:nitronate monooxygenase
MEKLTMADPLSTLQTRLRAALDGGIEGLTLSAGLHTSSLKMIADHPRFNDVKLGIIVSSARALKIFLRSAQRVNRPPDYIVVEGPLAGGHLGFGPDWQRYDLAVLVREILAEIAAHDLVIPVIAAGGIFTGTDAVEMIRLGASGVQVATRFTVTHECGMPAKVKQRYFEASEEDVFVSDLSPTGYPLRMLKSSPCINARVRPSCEAFGYVLSKDGCCPYIDAYQRAGTDANGRQMPVTDKICLCHHFARFDCYTCYRLSDTTIRESDGSYRILSAQHVFNDYRFSRNQSISLPQTDSCAETHV